MATTTDLTNPIHLPNGLDTANQNPVARSDKIIRQGQAKDVETSLSRLESSAIGWNFNNTVTDRSDPGSGNMAFNAALKQDVTFISFHVIAATESIRFDEIIDSLRIEDKILIQERDNPDSAAIYRVTGNAIGQGAYDEIPVTELRTQGLQFTNGARMNVTFFLFGADVTPSPDPNNPAAPVNLSEGLQDLNNHITVAGISGGAWQTASNPTNTSATITRLFAALWTENQRTDAGNFFDDLADPAITIPSQTNIHFFADANEQSNRFQGKQSWVDSTMQVNGSPLTTTFQKLIGFSALIPETITGNIPLLQLGPNASQIILRAVTENGQNKLQALTGNQDGTATTTTVRDYLAIINVDSDTAHFVGNVANSARFVVKAGDPVPHGYLIQVRQYINGAFTGGESQIITVADRDVDQTPLVANLFTGSAHPLALSYSYDADFDNNGTPTDTILLTAPSQGTSTTSYVIQVEYTTTEPILPSDTTTYSTINNISVNTEIDMLLLVEKTLGNDQASDPLLTMKIEVNGFQDNNVDFHIPASDFNFSNIQFGHTTDCFISNIQIYDYSATTPFDVPTHAVIHSFFQRRNDWLGLFQHPDFNSRDYTIDGGVILTDEDDTTFNIIERFKGIRTNTVHLAAAVPDDLISTLALPVDYTDYDFVHITERNAGPPVEWRHTLITTVLLDSGNVGSTDLIRVQGNTDLTWDDNTRALTTSGGALELYSVTLIDITGA